MLPHSSVIKDAFDKFEHDFQAANLPEGKYIKPPPSTAKWYKVGQPCYEEKIQELNTDFDPFTTTSRKMRRQELRNSPFWHSSLFKSQLVKEGEDFLLKKGTSKDSQGFGPYQNKPVRGPHNKKRGSYRKRPYGGNS